MMPSIVDLIVNLGEVILMVFIEDLTFCFAFIYFASFYFVVFNERIVYILLKSTIRPVGFIFFPEFKHLPINLEDSIVRMLFLCDRSQLIANCSDLLLLRSFMLLLVFFAAILVFITLISFMIKNCLFFAILWNWSDFFLLPWTFLCSWFRVLHRNRFGSL